MVFLRTGLGALAISLSLFAAPLAGCGDSTGTGSGGGSSDGGAGGGGTTATTSSAGGGATTATATTGAGGNNDCNLLVAGTAFAQTREATTAPAAVGGTIVDGTYDWTSSVVYTGAGGLTTPTGVMPSGAIRFGGANFEYLSVEPTQETRAAGTFTVSGTDLTTTYTCPFAAVVTAPYTATATTIAITSTDGSRVDTYTIQ